MEAERTIYLAGFLTGTGSGWVNGSSPGGDVRGCALCEDGEVLAEHLSSSIDFAKHDLGLDSTRKHDRYEAHCPEGYRLEWVEDPATHLGWREALRRNREMYQAEEGATDAD